MFRGLLNFGAAFSLPALLILSMLWEQSYREDRGISVKAVHVRGIGFYGNAEIWSTKGTVVVNYFGRIVAQHNDVDFRLEMDRISPPAIDLWSQEPRWTIYTQPLFGSATVSQTTGGTRSARYWPLVVFTGLLPLIWLLQSLLKWPRQREGYCNECGYDLRASNGRCPECGTAITPKSTSKGKRRWTAFVTALGSWALLVGTAAIAGHSIWRGEKAFNEWLSASRDLRTAVEHGDIGLTRAALARGGNANRLLSDYDTARLIHIAVRTRSAPIVTLLAQHGADVNNLDNGTSPLSRAMFDNSMDVVSALLAAGADPSAGNGSPLWAAVERQDQNLVESLVRAGADVNRRGPHETTPLQLACLFGNRRTVQFLLSHGARPDLKDDEGVTAADVARKWHPSLLSDLFSTTASAEKK